jgi:hypothetical protein
METIAELKAEIEKLKAGRHLIRNAVLDEAYAALEKIWSHAPLQAEKNTVTKCVHAIKRLRSSSKT